jgi:hypothetical protein
MLQCWHLVWILVRTDHPCLGVGWHTRLIPLAPERGEKIGGVAALSGEDCAAAAGGGFGVSRQLEGEVGRVRRCSEEGDGGSRAVHRATTACGGEREECEAEAVAPGKERDGAVATYRRRWRRSQTGAIERRRLLRMEGRRQRCDPTTPAALSNGRGALTQRERERERERGAAHRW